MCVRINDLGSCDGLNLLLVVNNVPAFEYLKVLFLPPHRIVLVPVDGLPDEMPAGINVVAIEWSETAHGQVLIRYFQVRVRLVRRRLQRARIGQAMHVPVYADPADARAPGGRRVALRSALMCPNYAFPEID